MEPACDIALLPFLKWAGGKRWLVSRYPQLFPTNYRRYVEPFLGGGAVFFALRPEKAILSDLNSDLVATYEAVKNDWKPIVDKLARHHKAHALHNDYYYRVRSSLPRSESGRAAKFIYLNRTCFNGLYRVNLRGEFNVPKGTKCAVAMDTDDFKLTATLLQKATLLCDDFENVLDKSGDGDFAFIDPPYTVQHNYNGFLKYNEKIFSWEDQRRLVASIQRLRDRGGRALVTNAAHQSVKELYKDLGQIHIVPRQSVLASDRTFRSKVEELAVCVGYRASEEFDSLRASRSYSRRVCNEAGGRGWRE